MHEYHIRLIWKDSNYKVYTKTIIVEAHHHDVMPRKFESFVWHELFLFASDSYKLNGTIPLDLIADFYYIDDDGTSYEQTYKTVPGYAKRLPSERMQITDIDNYWQNLQSIIHN